MLKKIFTSTLGIVIIIIVITVILVIMNRAAIRAWWNDETIEDGTQRTISNGTSSGSRCVRLGNGNCSYNGLFVPCAECTKRGVAVS